MRAEWQSLGIFGDLIFIFVVVVFVVELWHFYPVAGSWCPSDCCTQGIPVAFMGMGMGGHAGAMPVPARGAVDSTAAVTLHPNKCSLGPLPTASTPAAPTSPSLALSQIRAPRHEAAWVFLG